jgi:RNA polymerase sigma factor (TIGR02999 family)
VCRNRPGSHDASRAPGGHWADPIALNRESVRGRATEEFDTDWITDHVIATLAYNPSGRKPRVGAKDIITVTAIVLRAMSMTEVTQILSQIEQGDPSAAEQLLPLVYDELRKLAAARLAHEKPGQTLQATALVHDAYIRLVDVQNAQHWNSRGHFFGAAAEAMRRILVENARRRKEQKHGGGLRRVNLDHAAPVTHVSPEQLVALDDALSRLDQDDANAAQVFKLRYFAGLTIEQAAEALGISRATAYRHWTFARAWLQAQL